MKPKNPQRGTCPCPVRGCEHVAPLYQFQARSDDHKTRRFAGRHYGVCPEHGRFGGDGKPAMQEYILSEGTIWAEGHAPEGGDETADSPVKLQKTPVTAAAPPPKPAAPQAPAPPPARKPEPKAVWDL